MTTRPTLVAHRGYPTRYPENTLIGYRAAIAAGAQWIETDIQLTRDRSVMLYHDATLERISGLPGSILDMTRSEVESTPASHATVFGDRFADEPVASLEGFVELLAGHSNVQAMVEIKQESIDRFDVRTVVEEMHRRLESIRLQCVIISKNKEAILEARRDHDYRIGWVLPSWDDQGREFAEREEPDFMICKVKRFPQSDAEIWTGPWNWMIYNIDDADQALQQPSRGIGFVESNAIGELLNDPRLKP